MTRILKSGKLQLRLWDKYKIQEAEKALIKLLEDPNLEVRTIAVKALACTGTENSIEPLIKQLEEVSWNRQELAYRISIIETLGKLQDRESNTGL